MKPHLIELFTQYPGRWFTVKKIKTILKSKGLRLFEYNFNKEFLELRSEFELNGAKIIKFRCIGQWQYCLTKDPKLIAGHNNQLNKEIKVRQKRKINLAV